MDYREPTRAHPPIDGSLAETECLQLAAGDDVVLPPRQADKRPFERQRRLSGFTLYFMVNPDR